MFGKDTDLGTDLTKALQGMSFPANKDDVVKQAESNHADNELINMLKQLPPDVYQNIPDIVKRAASSDAAGSIAGKFTRH
ncbi:hypothetical protein CAI21_14785 [Alkalilimnicola ehrlichii]|uniref:DUF2795 domain-containing protein n=1 Tax=Alkalilimnicola ehrlichii TaxID=351052 RepID=A0A3E0WQE2_9GAMM|nr:DUF2795 domain-containing protein [Alkalilimnicola ehrlichii]RFA27304.1 hypothetical protein CAI21_14785 [Alkalilimnicola ehrlichii]RFA34413.1 hypothetical protein CAL65_15355 [Alkalilimnicola ehrlichii]